MGIIIRLCGQSIGHECFICSTIYVMFLWILMDV